METLNLEKGQKVDLSKAIPGLTKIVVGGGWDINKAAGGQTYDLDLSAYLINAAGKLTTTKNIVYFGAKAHVSGGVELDKDNLTGEGEGDDEKIFVDLSKIPADIAEVFFAINIYKAAEKKQNFGMVQNAFIRVVNPADNSQMMKYDLSEDYSLFTGVIAGKIYRKDGEWKFQAIGEGIKGDIAAIAHRWE